ncbi:GGDEF domain-containing protein [Glaciecola siphonariae]|uniref:diguanylate cyclase n=1 Tax=Glaciecola siphonariae TaxID=521012 RepID=A0ABV9LQ15_9ALTE
MNPVSLNTTEYKDIAMRTRADIIALLFAQSGNVLIGHIGIICIYAFWLSNTVDASSLTIWISLGVCISLARFVLSLAYQKYHHSALSQNQWVAIWTVLTILMSLSYAFAITVVTPASPPEYIMSTAALLFAVYAGSALSYATSLYAIACLTLPVSIISAAYMFMLNTHASISVGLSVVAFAGVTFLLVRKVNKALVKAIELNYQNQQEIDKRKLVERQLYDISRRDSLTGLFNRRYFDEMLEVELGRAYRSHSALSLVLLDVDYFKEYNDHYGHVAGDNCLVDLGQIIERQTNRKGDLVARYGGEEFAIILPGIDAKGALAYAKRLQSFVQSQRLEHKATKLTSLNCLTISVGVTSVVPVMKIKPRQLIDQADKALYDAKNDGRNRVKAFAPFGIDHEGLK